MRWWCWGHGSADRVLAQHAGVPGFHPYYLHQVWWYTSVIQVLGSQEEQKFKASLGYLGPLSCPLVLKGSDGCGCLRPTYERSGSQYEASFSSIAKSRSRCGNAFP